MRIDTVSTSILLMFLGLIEPAASTTLDPTTAPQTTKKITVPPPTTTTPIKPETTTTMNPNVKLIENAQRDTFMANSNGHRDRHLMGRYAFVWSWDPTLVDSAISRIVDSCDPKIDNSDEIRELSLTEDDWRLIRRDRKTLNQKMVGVTYESGIARVGCVGRINCQNSTLGDTFYFCHFAPSNFTKDPDFKKGQLGKCEHDSTYTSLCQDVPDKPLEYVTVLPMRIVYRDRASAKLNVIVLMITVLAYEIWK